MRTLENLELGLLFMSCIYVLAILLVWSETRDLFTSQKLFDVSTEMEGEDRNESSTPRSFVLPATPAIALEQEIASIQTGNPAFSCAIRLAGLGYDVGRMPPTDNAKLKVAIFKFQKKLGLIADGTLNVATRIAVGC
jgi:hypothetical protein